MRVSILVPAIAVVLAAAPAAFAGMSSNQSCSTLESQFDQAAKAKAPGKTLTDAEALRAEGAKLCATSMPQNGISYLHSALKDLGVKPQV
ncbi:MAG TPA: hypothetical protein VMQ73_14020 [Methylomirabilota bacterium]|nr:hypothetical protein [Methylomirabilota bacterium]